MTRYYELQVEIASGSAAVDKELADMGQLIQGDAEVMEKLNLAESAEEAYACIKKYAQVTLEEFRRVYDFLYEGIASKARPLTEELTDDELDIVVGGSCKSWFKNAFKKISNVACAAASAVKSFAVKHKDALIRVGKSVLTGAITGGIGGAFVGGAHGALIGAAGGAVGGLVVGILNEIW